MDPSFRAPAQPTEPRQAIHDDADELVANAIMPHACGEYG